MEQFESESNVKKMIHIGTVFVAVFLAQTRAHLVDVIMAQEPKRSYNSNIPSDKNMEQQNEAPQSKAFDIHSTEDREFVLRTSHQYLNFHGAKSAIEWLKTMGKEWEKLISDEWSSRLEKTTDEDLTSAQQTGLEYALKMIYVIRMINDNKEMQNKLEGLAQKILSRALRPMNETEEIFSPEEEQYPELNKKRPYEAYIRRLNFLQRLSETQISTEGRDKCARACLAYERNSPLTVDDLKKNMVIGEEFLKIHKETLSERSLQELPQLQKSYPKIFEHATVDNGQIVLTLPTAMNGEEEQWNILIIAKSALFLRSCSDSKRAFMFEPDLLNDNPHRFIALAKQSAIDTEHEKSEEQKKVMKNYELPKDRPVVVLRVIDTSSLEKDAAMKTALSTSSLKAGAFKLRYPNVSLLAPIFVQDQDPTAAIENEISQTQKEHKRDDIHIILDLYSHGQQDGLDFGKEKFTAENLLSIANKKSSCTFTVDTIACYGGGLVTGILNSQDFQNDAALQKQIALFTHAKSNAPNVGESLVAVFHGAEVSSGLGFSDVYTREFIRHLIEGKTYGEAALEADDATKKTWFTDGEAVIHGKKLSQATPCMSDEYIAALLEKEIDNFG